MSHSVLIAMLFSIITICYNASTTIARTLASVDAQTYTDYEHLIIDGASKDGTQAIVDAIPNPRRKLFSEPDKGLYDAMNKGIAKARGEYLIFLNAGDKFHSVDTLALIADTIKSGDKPDIVYGQTLIVDNDGNPLGPRHLTAPANLTTADFARGMLVCHQAFVARRDIVPQYDLTYRYSADFDWCIKCLQNSRKNIGLVDTYLIDYLSEGMTTANRLPSLRERFRIMAHYYGLLPTTFRHIGFVGRALKRKIAKK